MQRPQGRGDRKEAALAAGVIRNVPSWMESSTKLPGEMSNDSHSPLGRVTRKSEDRVVACMGTLERRLTAVLEISQAVQIGIVKLGICNFLVWVA